MGLGNKTKCTSFILTCQFLQEQKKKKKKKTRKESEFAFGWGGEKLCAQ